MQRSSRFIKSSVRVQRRLELEIRAKAGNCRQRRRYFCYRCGIEQPIRIVFGKHLALERRYDEPLVVGAEPARGKAVGIAGNDGIDRGGGASG